MRAFSLKPAPFITKSLKTYVAVLLFTQMKIYCIVLVRDRYLKTKHNNQQKLNNQPHFYMNEQSILVAYTGSLADGSHIQVMALDRRNAVHKIMEIYWGRFPGTNAKERLTIDDPSNEVIFDEGMRCNDTLYSYLPQHMVQKLVERSKGVIGIDPNYPNSRCQLVRLIKKKGKKKRYIPQPKPQKTITPIDRAILAAKKMSRSQNIWLSSSRILPTETHPEPTVVLKEHIHRTGREALTHMHLTEVYCGHQNMS